mgnify:FL=1
MDQINLQQPNQNNPPDHESFSLPTKTQSSTKKKVLIIGGIILVIVIFFAGGMYLRSYFSPKPDQASVAQVPAGFTFPTVNPPAAPTSTAVADSIDSIEKDLNAIDLKTFEADINKDLGNISKSL